jgi:hypothetical protein
MQEPFIRVASWRTREVSRNAFLLRLDPRVLESLRKWADDELRSLNGQIEFLLRDALRRAGRWPDEESSADGTTREPPPN